MQLLQWQTRGTEISRTCSVCCGRHLDGCEELFSLDREIDYLCFSNYTRNRALLSTSIKMSQNVMPTFTYQRKRSRNNPAAIFNIESSAGTKPIDACKSPIFCEAPLLSAGEHAVSVSECATEGVTPPVVHPVEKNKVATPSANGICAAEEAGVEKALTTDVDRTLNDCSGNDICSSSKSNLELSSAVLKNPRDDAGECSSSGALIAEEAPKEISERDVLLSIFRSQGLLDEVRIRQNRASKEKNGLSSNNYCSKSCKICARKESTRNMLICDNCDGAFHTSCCNPRIKILPVGEWLCSSCLKKKHKLLKDKATSSNLVNITESGRNRYSASELELGSLAFLFRDTEPYMSNARIGDEFQADVPDWHGPTNEECNLSGDPLETATFNNISMQETDTIESLKRSPIGNWLQCREVIGGAGEGVDGTVCGKWRRAPLFEVQTDNWECFRCILWNPAHADCAVPQEIETEEVMKQLKYMEMLRPRLAPKRRKLNSSKGSGSQDVSR